MNKKKTTAGYLAERFGVSVRTIYRDLDALSAAGVPLYTTKGKNGGIFLMEDYYLSGTTIKEEEAQSIKAALETLKAAKYPDVDVVIDKMGAILRRPAEDSAWISIDFTPWGSNFDENKRFTKIKTAVLSHRTIKFNYTGSNGKETKREVEPYRLWYKGNGWYLFAYCLVKQDFRLFRITRIQNLKLTDTYFRPREVFPAQEEAQEQDMLHVALTLQFTPEMRYRIYDDFDQKHITLNPDGSGTVDVLLPDTDWMYGYLLTYGSGVEVVAPSYVRHKMLHMIKAIEAKYS